MLSRTSQGILVAIIRRFLVAAGLALVSATSPVSSAFAAQALGEAILTWVYAVDASPSWTAKISDLNVDDENNNATIGNLEIGAEGGGASIAVQGIELIGYAEQADGGFTAKSLRIGDATIKTASVGILLHDVELDDVGVPAMAGIAYDKSKPFTSLVAAFAAIAKGATSGGRVAEAAVIERMNGVDSRISYNNVVIGRLADGKIDQLRAAPLKLDSPSPNPLVELSVASAEASAVDLDAFVRLYDPLRYVAGVGDNVWKTAVGATTYRDILMTTPGINLKLGSVTVEDFKIRQPFLSFAPLIDAMTAEAPVSAATMQSLKARYLAGLLSAYGAGRFALEDIDLAIAGIDQLTFDRIGASDISSDKIGEFAVEGFIGAVAGQGAVAVARLAFGDIAPAPVEKLVQGFQGLQNGADVDLSSLVPKLGAIDAVGINLQAVDFPGAGLGRMRADFKNYVGSVPTSVDVDIDGLDVATASLQPDRARSLIASLGYERIRADVSFNLIWREANGTLNLDDFRLDIADFGNTTANVVLAGLTREAIEQSNGRDLLSGLLFDRANVTFEDKSLVERSLSMRAELLKVPLDRLRQQLAGAVPLMLAFVGNPETVKEIVPVLQTFIKTPGTLTIEAAPEPPVPIAEIEEAARRRPQSLPGMLGLKLSGTPGPSGAPKEPAKSDPPTTPKPPKPEKRPGSAGPTGSSPAPPP